ncbi:PfkB family carbohydrate kinase [Falsiroseomonas sp. HW251]|uniref:PfkB family carbohydrate kinase n=1 Tax=Falsiroseomonas sp. HW251 TaxID=3390998 RepID=UPI003D31490A
MTGLLVVGGIYRERCVWPEWKRTMGSAGRAAIAVAGFGHPVRLIGYAAPEVATEFEAEAQADDIGFQPIRAAHPILFDYVHGLSIPRVVPDPIVINREAPIEVAGDVVLRFGMLEGTALVDAGTCVYDPQSAYIPERFRANGSKASRLAIVANRGEVCALGGEQEPIAAARKLMQIEAAEVVVVKSGSRGAIVVTSGGEVTVPAYQTRHVWPVGSGDVFAAAFAEWWGVQGLAPEDAAGLASRATADYVESSALPINPALRSKPEHRPEALGHKMRVYLAGPFFSIAQRWLVDDVRRCLREMGMDVFSPVHDVGRGPAQDVAPKDIQALRECDVVFALVDGLDSGTIFEAGFARALGKPVYCLSQAVGEEDLKMLVGTECRIHSDLVTALHHLHWRA